MGLKSLNRAEAKKIYEEWLSGAPDYPLPSVDIKYLDIREKIDEFDAEVRDEIEQKGLKKSDYYLDSHLGLKLYEYLGSLPDFNMRTASDDGFWRFLSVQVSPDIVGKRYGRENDSHYYSRATRIWFRAMWWFIHLSWQGSYNETKALIENPNMTTDTVLNLVERAGRRGTYVEAYRRIVYYYNKVSTADVKRGAGQRDLFRDVMILNTARMQVIDPELFTGGLDGYAKSLYTDLGVKINEA